ncbi:MAG: homoserine dehydrogenase [Mastigocoleus sp.]
MGVKLGILGLGTVGTGTVELLANPTQGHPLLQSVSISKVGVRSLDKFRQVEIDQDLLTTDLEAIVSDSSIDIVVELIGGLEPARSLILKAIENGKHIVTANKAVISRFGAEIFDAASKSGVYVMLEAAVGGGIPVISPLRQYLIVNRIDRVMGIVNGTTNYILTQMQEKGSKFEDALADAQNLGYAEADPTADVDGLDAADKIAILTSIAFCGCLNRDNVYTEGIRQVSRTDIAYAEKLGFTIKLLAIASRNPKGVIAQAVTDSSLSVRVHPTLLPKSHPLASINDVYNAILVEGEPIGQVMFFGPGAGKGATASAVCADILNLVSRIQTASQSNTNSLDPLLVNAHKNECHLSSMAQLATRFYARFLTKDQPGVIGKLGTTFGKYGVSLESVVQTGFQEKLAEIVVVTHDVTEGDFHKALDEIRTAEAIDSIPSLFRVL